MSLWYSGFVDVNEIEKRVLFLRQVDDFACAAANEETYNHVFDLLDDHLTLPLKRLERVSLFNGIDVEQTELYIKIGYQTYLDRICQKYLDLK